LNVVFIILGASKIVFVKVVKKSLCIPNAMNVQNPPMKISSTPWTKLANTSNFIQIHPANVANGALKVDFNTFFYKHKYKQN
jgi:hypothetical protein